MRLHDLEAMAAAIAGLHFAVQSYQHAGAEFVLEIRRVKPNTFQRVAALADGHLEQRHAAGAKESEGADLGDNAGHLAGTQFADAARVEPVFVAKRQVVEQVLDVADALLQQDFGEARANALDVLHVGGEIEHREMVNERKRSAFSTQHSAVKRFG